MRETTVYERDIAKKENEGALAAVRASKKTEVYVLGDAERKRWRETLLPVHAKFEQMVGRDNLQAVYRIAAAVAADKAEKKK